MVVTDMVRAIEECEDPRSGDSVGWMISPMTKGKRKAPAKRDMTFGEALRRFVETTRAEISETRGKINEDQQEVDRYVENLEEEIKRGGRRPRRRFRL
jgi:hypothetical protein